MAMSKWSMAASKWSMNFLRDQIKHTQERVDNWMRVEFRLREKYGDDPKPYERTHIRTIKGYRKEAQAELKKWQQELKDAENMAMIEKIMDC